MRTLYSRRMSVAAIADDVAAVVERGGTAIFPTDTVYGIGCEPTRQDAVEKVYALKDRARDKPLSLHVGSVAELLEYAAGNELAARAAAAFLPGPLTVVVRRPDFVGAWVTSGRDTLGLRCPKHALCTAILERCGPLAGTSANYSGLEAYTGNEMAAPLPLVDIRVEDGPTPVGVESTIIDVSTHELRLVREGAIGVMMLEQMLGTVAVRSAPAALERNGEP